MRCVLVPREFTSRGASLLLTDNDYKVSYTVGSLARLSLIVSPIRRNGARRKFLKFTNEGNLTTSKLNIGACVATRHLFFNGPRAMRMSPIEYIEM